MPLEFLKSIHSPQTRLKKTTMIYSGFGKLQDSLKAQRENYEKQQML